MGDIVHFILDTAGVGGLILSAVLGSALLTYFLLTRWILQGGREETMVKRRAQRPPWVRR